MKTKPVVLIVLDGWGLRDQTENNPIHEAQTPFFDQIWQENPHSLLEASGPAVGLPEGQMGNSEVGHITIGAGKILDTDLVRISKSAFDDQMKHNKAFQNLFDHVKKHDSTLHLLGLIGDGGVHAHEDHLEGIIKAAKHHGVKKIAIHAFTDGRDTPPQSSSQFLENIEHIIEREGIGFIASASGRFYAMDRDQNWDRVERVEKLLFEGESQTRTAEKPSTILRQLYKRDIIDEHLEPILFLDQDEKHYQIEKNDGVFLFNFRADRSRQISQKIIEKKKDLNLHFATLTQYDSSFESETAYLPELIETTLAKEISKAGLAQAHLAETEKFAHATYYLNGGTQTPHSLEKHILIESRKDIQTHDQAPEMKAHEIAEAVITIIEEGKTPFIFINFANPDMVGHTGNRLALLKALEVVDQELKRVVEAIQTADGICFITADHGNAEYSLDQDGLPHTAHSTSVVPALLIGSPNSKLKNGTLADIAPTILELLNLPKPEAMTGESLLVSSRQ